MRGDSWEIYSTLRVRPPLILRADGRGFHKALDGSKKPYDEHFARSMASASRSFMEDSGLSPKLAFLFSDEVNLLFLDLPFNGRLEKLDSIAASYLSSALSLNRGRILAMDCRALPLCSGEIGEYLSQCQDEAWRNHVFSYGFYALVEEGRSHGEAMGLLRGMKESQIHEMLFERGLNLAHNPAWQRRGVLIYREEGSLVEEWAPPLFRSMEGVTLLGRLIP
ncbi:MAG: tRNA 5'-guanylyltransferase [Methanotrichaceae archaeon]|nr:tRNA 5'-guanylyltransferase [Methanotrichaceae archaeon]